MKNLLLTASTALVLATSPLAMAQSGDRVNEDRTSSTGVEGGSAAGAQSAAISSNAVLAGVGVATVVVGGLALSNSGDGDDDDDNVTTGTTGTTGTVR